MDEQVVQQINIRYWKKGLKLGIIISVIIIAVFVIAGLFGGDKEGAWLLILEVSLVTWIPGIIIFTTAIGGIVDLVHHFEKK